MKKSSKLYERTKNMVMSDNFGALPADFADKLGTLMSEYFVYDGLQVTAETGAENNLLLSVSVKKVKPLRLPTE